MKKLMISIVCAGMLLISGCQKKTTTDDTAAQEYKAYYNTVSETTAFASSSKNFTCELEMTQVADSSYRYYVVIDDPQIAMYDVVAIVVENDVSYDDAEKMMPSIGIFDDKKSLVPNQVDTDNGFVKGIALSGESSESSIQIKLLVQWMDKTKKNTTREFLKYDLTAETK